MKKILYNSSSKQAFTLVEILVSLTILSIIMVSVMVVFVNSTQLSAKSDINRIMQENVKNLISNIGEDIRKNSISGVSKSSVDTCDFTLDSGTLYKKGNKLCINLNEYYLASDISGTLTRVDDIDLNCGPLKKHCILVKNGFPLTNSMVSIKDLKFYLSTDNNIPKVTMSILIQPAIKKGVKSDLIKNSTMLLQTTFSERPF